jgi:signal transduction histidine kinase
MQMAEMVHDLALLLPLQRLFASIQSEAEMLGSIREAAWILFGPGPLAFLMLSPDNALLSGAHFSSQPVLLQQIKIPLDSAQSLAVDVALGKKPSSATFEQELPTAVSLVDVQIARILGSEGLLYIPFKSRTRIIGLMVFGVSASRNARLTKNLRLVTLFATTAATSLEVWRETQKRDQSVINGQMNDVNHETAMMAGRVDVNTLIDGMIALYGESLFTSHGIKVEKDLETGLATVISDRDSIRQIFYYLWKNASEATAAGGYFAISTHDNINQDGRLYVEVRMSDTGPGLPPEVMQRLFRAPAPVTTCSGHVGLGLTIVAALVKQINGRITCQSKTGRGTRYSILIPKYGNV